MADLVTGGVVQWCGAVPGSEPVAVGEAADVSDVGQQASRAHSLGTLAWRRVTGVACDLKG